MVVKPPLPHITNHVYAHAEASFSLISTYLFALLVARAPRSPKQAILCGQQQRQQTYKPIVLPLAHVRDVHGVKIEGGWGRG